MPEFSAEQIINGVNGELHIQKEGGSERNLIGNVMNIAATVNIDRKAIRIAGKYNSSYKRMGWTGEGSLVVYRVNTMAFDAMRDSANHTSRMPIYEIEMALNDADSVYAIDGAEEISDASAERLILQKVKFWNFDWGFNVEELVDQTLEFTFEGMKLDMLLGTTSFAGSDFSAPANPILIS